MFSDGYIYCNNCESSWYTDDNYHWYISDPGHSQNSSKIKQLEDYEIISIEDYIIENDLTESETEFLFLLQQGEIKMNERLVNQLNLIPDIPKPLKWEINDRVYVPDNILLHDDDGNGYCPGCYNKLSG